MAAEAPSGKLTGAQRAAVLLLSLGEEGATAVLKHMGVREVQTVGSAMAALSNVSREQVNTVLESFTKSVEQQVPITTGTEDYLRRILSNALGEQKASGLIDRILLGRGTKGLETLKWLDSRAVAEMIGHEHPQIIAIVLAHLDADQAAEVMGHLSSPIRADVVMRIAALDGVPPTAMTELEEIMEKQFAGNNAKFQSLTVGGLKAAANILNAMKPAHETEVMEGICSADADLSQRIQELMFVFEDLLALEDRNMQTLLRDVPTDRLVVALKGADQALRDKIFSNMSKRAADMLADDLEVKGPVKVSEVEVAQKEILTIARRLADEGKINLGGRGGDDYV